MTDGELENDAFSGWGGGPVTPQTSSSHSRFPMRTHAPSMNRRRLRGPGSALAAISTMAGTLLVLSGCATVGPAAETPPPAGTEPDLSESRLFHAEGGAASMADVVTRAGEVDVVFVGELHGNPGAHALQLRILEALIGKSEEWGREIVLSMEMFEADVQLLLDEYLSDLIPESQFLAAARPWRNYERDYRPLVELARAEGVPVVAANAPRRYVNRVGRLGPESLDDLSPDALEYLPPLPYPEPSDAYRAEWDRRMEAITHGHEGAHGGELALQAQALWDAAMAYAIHEALGEEGARPESDREPLVLHLTGSFHVENRTGIPEALERYRPGVRSLVITTRVAEDPHDFAGATGDLDAKALADFILLTVQPPG